jgi:trehalose 6-phosphate synthase/phosphatase
MAERLIVVSNRLPVTARRTGERWTTEPSSGGLVAALAPVIERMHGVWIGWPGDQAPAGAPGRDELLAGWERERHLAVVDLPAHVARPFYEGYSNETLWPLLHGFPTLGSFDTATWHAYRDANERFAKAVLERVRPGDLVWVHDYQLMLLPGLLREAVPDMHIGFFLHIPFPSAEIFRILPEREALLQGLLGADLVAFQTHEHLGNFRRSLLQVSGIESRMDSVETDGRSIALEAMPIGIEAEGWDRLLADARVRARVAELIARRGGRRTLLAVDRLDHTKGIPERLRAYRTLLQRRPGLRGQVVLLQIAVPSRERVPSYAALRREVNELVGEINGSFGTPEWSPVTYLRRPVPKTELAALYASADVAWVAPLRDGMNLVAKEYVACQGDGAGVLVLSEFAGAASELGEAIRVNPYDEVGSAEAVERALTMAEDERRERQVALLARVRGNGAFAWTERFIARLEAEVERPSVVTGSPSPPFERLQASFRAASTRTLFLDYDGTLVPLAARPADAVPSERVLEIVGSLAAEPGTNVVIISGRAWKDLERWFGDMPGLWLAAEHGALLRRPDDEGWRPLRGGADTAWKERVRPILEDFAARTPGSLVEEKDYALAWHYRLAEAEFGDWLANELASTLDERLSATELAVLRGRKVVEVRFVWAQKGEVAAHILSVTPDPAFLLALGDDRTDEDLFERLPPEAWTIRVGQGRTRARYRLANPSAAVGLLAALADEEPEERRPAKRAGVKANA